MSNPIPYRVRGKRTSCNVTYNCRTADLALLTLGTFLEGEYTDVECIRHDGQPVSLADLIAMVEPEPESGAPVDIGAPSAPRMLALA